MEYIKKETLKILLYMDPFVDYLYKDNSRSFVLRYDMMPALLARQFNQEASVKIFCNEKILKENELNKILKGLTIKSINKLQIDNFLKESSLSPESIIRGNFNNIFLIKYKKILSSLDENCEPNIILSWGIIPDYLCKIYPNSIILEAEHSALFRIYQEADTIYFPKNQLTRSKLFNYINNLELNLNDRNALYQLKVILEKLANPLGTLSYKYFSDELKDKKIIFYPGHFSSPYALYFSKYINDNEILSEILKNIPDNTIILYLNHPLNNDLPQIVNLSDKIIDISPFSKIDNNITLKAIYLCDLLVNSHSKTSFLALLLNKDVIEIDNFYYSEFCEKNIDQITTIINNGYPQYLKELQKKLVFYLITHTISQKILQCENCYKDIVLNYFKSFKNFEFQKLKITMSIGEVCEKINNSLISPSIKINRKPNEYDKIKACIISNKYTNICFDVFDTLLWRPFNRPTDLFYIISKEVSKLLNSARFNFLSARISAEWHARRKNANGYSDDITLEDIYKSFSYLFDVPLKTSYKILNIEKDYEKKFIQCRKSARNLVVLAKLNCKNIYAVSDMYLSSKFISYLLEIMNYPIFNKVIVSCEEGATKNTGRLFNVLKEKYDIDPYKSIFIGDNKNSDFIIPQKFGFKSFYFPSAIQCMKEKTNFVHFENIIINYSVSTHFAVIANIIFDNPYINFDKKTILNNSNYLLGIIVLGPFLLNFVAWLIDNIKLKTYKVLLFCSRDCFIIEKIYKMYKKYNVNLPDGKYFYVSRKSIMPCYQDKNNIVLLPTMYNSRYNAFDFITKYLNIDKNYEILQEHKRYLKNIGYSKIEQSKLHDFLKKIQINIPDIKNKQNLIYKYIIQETNSNEFAIVDSGARGTTRDAISDLLGKKIDLYLLREYRYKYSDNKIISYHKESFNYFRPGRQAFASAFYEPLISRADENSCEGYKLINNKIIPIYSIKEPTKCIHNISIVQRGTLDFAESYINIFKDISNDMIMEPSTEIYKSFLEFIYARMSDSNFLESSFYHEDILNSDRKQSIIMPPLKNNLIPIKQNIINNKDNNINYNSSLKQIIMKFERIILLLILSERKKNKYIRDRRSFFIDSKYKILQYWYSFFK